MNNNAAHSALVNAIWEDLGRERDLTLWKMQPVAPPDDAGRPLHCGPVGMADLCGILDGGAWFCLEVKTGRGKQRPRQILWGNLIRRRGGFYCVVRSTDDARAALARARMGLDS